MSKRVSNVKRLWCVLFECFTFEVSFAWLFISVCLCRRVVQIVDCCRYLGQQSAECDTKGLVSILTNCSPADPKLSLRVKQTLQTAQQEGNARTDQIHFISRC